MSASVVIVQEEKEKHYTLQEVARAWNISRATVIRLFENRPGVIVIEGPRKGKSRDKSRRTIRIPQSVVDAVHREIAGK